MKHRVYSRLFWYHSLQPDVRICCRLSTGHGL